jgi:hypothetical protein
LSVLPKLDSYDAVLIDGDHNWYTVFHELKLIEAYAQQNRGKLPIIFLHDTDWPYGRRDMYYFPETIPEKFRHPFLKKGMRKGISELVEGGSNSDLNNAMSEYGERNGVLTAVEDFLNQTKLPYHFFNLTSYNGLGIIIPREEPLNHFVKNTILLSGVY